MSEPDTEVKEYEPVPYTATSFAALTAARKEMEAAEHVADLAEDLKALTANIFANPEVTDKAGFLKALADEFAALVAQPPEEKGIEGVGTYNRPPILDGLQFESPEHAQLYAEVDRLIARIITSQEPERSMLRQRLADVLATRVAKEAMDADPARAAIVEEVATDDKADEPDQKEAQGFWSRIATAVKDWIGASPEPEPQPAPFVLWKEASGGYRWLATYSNKYRDRDNPPEILSEAAHQDFVKAIDTGDWPMPELWLWHVPGTALGKADWVTYADGFALASGTVDKQHTAIAERIDAMPDPLAVSHGMPVGEIERAADDATVITRYRTREISVLPAWAAANALTGFDIQEVTTMAIPKEKRDFLLAAGLTEDSVATIEAQLDDKSKQAADAGLEYKAAEEQPPAEQKDETMPAEVPVAEVVPPAPAPVAALTAQDIAAAVRDVLVPIEERLTALESLKEQIGALNKAQDERVAEQLAATPAASLADLLRGAMGHERAIGNPEARVDGRSSLAKAGPKETEGDAETPQLVSVPWINNLIQSSRPQ